MNPSTDNGWNEHKRMVLAGMTDCKVQGARTYSEMVALRIDFEKFAASMKVKSGVWGLLGGLLPAVGILLVVVLKKG